VFYQRIIVFDGVFYLVCESALTFVLLLLVLQYNESKSMVLNQLQEWPLVPDAGSREVREYRRFYRYRLPGSEQQNHILAEGTFRIFADQVHQMAAQSNSIRVIHNWELNEWSMKHVLC